MWSVSEYILGKAKKVPEWLDVAGSIIVNLVESVLTEISDYTPLSLQLFFLYISNEVNFL